MLGLSSHNLCAFFSSIHLSASLHAVSPSFPLPHLPLMLHFSPISASLPYSISPSPPSISLSTANSHPASHNSSLEPSQGPAAASCNRAKSDCNQREKTEPLRQLAQPGKQHHPPVHSLHVWVPAGRLKLALIKTPYRKCTETVRRLWPFNDIRIYAHSSVFTIGMFNSIHLYCS